MSWNTMIILYQHLQYVDENLKQNQQQRPSKQTNKQK